MVINEKRAYVEKTIAQIPRPYTAMHRKEEVDFFSKSMKEITDFYRSGKDLVDRQMIQQKFISGLERDITHRTHCLKVWQADLMLEEACNKSDRNEKLTDQQIETLFWFLRKKL